MYLKSGHQVDIMLTNFSIEFDTIDHNILTVKVLLDLNETQLYSSYLLKSKTQH